MMGYWLQDRLGEPFIKAEGGNKMIWGDAPADIMGEALRNVILVFQEDVGRIPTEEEMKAGLLFSLGGALEEAKENA